MKDPAIVFYTSDFMVGVSNLTMEERGQYITLLCLQHQLGHLSKKTIDLNIPNVSEDVLNKFQLDEDNKYYNLRLENEIFKRSKFIEHQRENGKKGGRPKKADENPKETQKKPKIKAKQKPLEDEDDNENEINNIYNYIESNFNRTLSPIEYEEISKWEDNDLTRYAVKLAVLNGAYSIKYITKILYNWEKEGIKTVQQIQEKEKKYKKVNEEVPEWFDKELKNESLTEEEKKEQENLLQELMTNINEIGG